MHNKIMYFSGQLYYLPFVIFPNRIDQKAAVECDYLVLCIPELLNSAPALIQCIYHLDSEIVSL